MAERKTTREQREDGRLTKEKLIECAGKLAAQKGFALVTSKEICQMAGTNLAAINYHFGSREGFYEELLYKIHQFMVNEDKLKDIANGSGTPREKINKLVDMIAGQVWSQENWQMTVWTREVMTTSQSEQVTKVLMQVVQKKGSYALSLFSQYTGLAIFDIRLYLAFMCFMAPILLVTFAKHSSIDYHQISGQSCSNEEILKNVKQFCFAGLDSYRENNE